MCGVYTDGIEHCQVVNADGLPTLNDVGSYVFAQVDTS